MGIKGLLKAFEDIMTDRHLSYYRGKRMAVDGYCWLHKSVLLISNEIFSNPNSKKYMIYLKKRLDHLLQYNIIPVMVFDGDKLPMKKFAEEEREKHRKEVHNTAMTLLNQGLFKEAQSKMTESIDIKPEMAYEFIKELKKRKIEYYVAPYEADAQLAYLSKKGLVDCVITEDSDLIALGCKRILFKLDPETDIGKEMSFEDKKFCKEFSFSNFSEDKFLTFCILAGCDYFKVKGVGIKNAYNAIKDVSSYTQCLALIKKKNPGAQINDLKVEEFEKAFLTFKYQVVYSPIEQQMVHLNPIENSKYKFLIKYTNDLSFLGKIYDKVTTHKIVFGEIDPISHLSFGNSSLKENNNVIERKNEEEHQTNVQYNIININNSNLGEIGLKVYNIESNQSCKKAIEEKRNTLLHKKRSVVNGGLMNEKEFELDIKLDIRKNDEEEDEVIINERKKRNFWIHKAELVTEEKNKENKGINEEDVKQLDKNNKFIIPIEISSDSSSNSEREQINKDEKENKDLNNSLDKLNEFDDFLDSCEKKKELDDKLYNYSTILTKKKEIKKEKKINKEEFNNFSFIDKYIFKEDNYVQL